MNGSLAAITADQVVLARHTSLAAGHETLDGMAENLQVTGSELTEVLSRLFGEKAYSASEMHDLEAAFDVLEYQEAVRRDCILLRDGTATLILLIADPFSDGIRRWAEETITQSFMFGLAQTSDIRAYLAKHEETLHAMESVVPGDDSHASPDTDVETLSLRSISEHTSPVVKLVHSTLYDALKSGASDIHLETVPSGLGVKYRIDGVLSQVGNAPGGEFADQVISRIKVMAELDIAERRVPQDGRFKIAVSDRQIDFRVSIMPSVFGEDAVLRILDKRALADQMSGLRLDHLGFDDETMASLRQMADEPHGMFLVTGPTGSGKTTTLYAALTEINNGRDKIVTIEDPVEYQLAGVLQIPVNEKKGLTFARGLRSILRHDPDKIMVGEIRDQETAQIAIQAALTGHLVFTTVHANSALDVIGRFMHMGVDPYSLVSALNVVVAQRLVRQLCPSCAIDDVPDSALLAKSGLSERSIQDFRFRKGRGCGQCRGTGYKGRRGIAELLTLNDELRELISGKEPTRRIKEAANRQGTRFLREAAIDLVRNGVTTLEEINRVTLVA